MGMARTIWKGSLSFGLVNVPIGVYPATQDKSIHFNQFERGTSDRIRYKKVNERTGKEVESANIVKGVDLGGGEYVILDEDELAAAEPERSRYIEITDFVSLNEIDPVYFNTTYYLAPEGETAGKAYALLRQAMQDSGKVAIATFVMRNKEYLVAIRPEADVLALETMYFADEVRSPLNELPNLANAEEPSEREIKMAELLIESMEGSVGSQPLPRHASPEDRGADRGEAPGQDDRRRGRRPGRQQGRRPDGGPERQHQGPVGCGQAGGPQECGGSQESRQAGAGEGQRRQEGDQGARDQGAAPQSVVVTSTPSTRRSSAPRRAPAADNTALHRGVG